MRDGAQWLSNHYAANDYYCEGEHVVGFWAGKGAEFFGIAGQQIEPQNDAFLRLFSGQTPEGEKLKPHESEIIGYDFQCSAQKYVSIMAKLGGDDRLLEAHKQAVTEAYGKLESLACVKEGTLGIDRRRVTTGVLCSARFDHDTSRALDPHIHTHFATANFSVTPQGRRYAPALPKPRTDQMLMIEVLVSSGTDTDRKTTEHQKRPWLMEGNRLRIQTGLPWLVLHHYPPAPYQGYPAVSTRNPTRKNSFVFNGSTEPLP
ncbi:MAG: hypothetical protein QOE55_6514 [Acidobacteriaceae bacterium]|nr:hypothetical protein [Acidobacteriaceae bacterium]